MSETGKNNGKRKVYRVGVVGCGRIGSLLEEDPLRGKPATHAGAFAQCPATAIAAGCDIDQERLALFGERWGVARRHPDYRRMMENEKLDIVSVASWTETHAGVVAAAVAAGVKGIYCEKPIAVNLAEAKRMIKMCEKAGVAMVVGHERRWGRRFRVIRDMLRSGELGRLRSVTGYMLASAPPRLSRRKYGGGTMFHDGTHLVDLFRFYAGDAQSVIAIEDRPHGRRHVENTAMGIIDFKDGVKGFILGGGEREYFHFEIDIQTDSARVLLGNHTAELYRTAPSKQFTGFAELERAPFPNGGPEVNPFVGGVEDLIREMETGEPSISGGWDGYKALETITAIYRSAGRGGAPVRLPL